MENKYRAWLKPALWILGIASLVVLAYVFDIRQILKDSLDWMKDLGSWGIIVFIFTYILVCVLFLPGSILTLGAGAIFGVVKGYIIVAIGSTVGATCAFLISRYFVRGWVESKIERNPKFKAIDQAVAKEGWKIVLLTRLSPVFPFNLLNYAYGVTQVKLRDYVFASWAGMMPGTILFVYAGSLAQDAAAGVQMQWPLRIVGFIAALLATVFITRTAKKALDQKVA